MRCRNDTTTNPFVDRLCTWDSSITHGPLQQTMRRLKIARTAGNAAPSPAIAFRVQRRPFSPRRAHNCLVPRPQHSPLPRTAPSPPLRLPRHAGHAIRIAPLSNWVFYTFNLSSPLGPHFRLICGRNNPGGCANCFRLFPIAFFLPNLHISFSVLPPLSNISFRLPLPPKEKIGLKNFLSPTDF